MSLPPALILQITQQTEASFKSAAVFCIETQVFCVHVASREPAGQHRPQHPHIEGGAGRVSAVEERARAD